MLPSDISRSRNSGSLRREPSVSLREISEDGLSGYETRRDSLQDSPQPDQPSPPRAGSGGDGPDGGDPGPEQGLAPGRAASAAGAPSYGLGNVWNDDACLDHELLGDAVIRELCARVQAGYKAHRASKAPKAPKTKAREKDRAAGDLDHEDHEDHGCRSPHAETFDSPNAGDGDSPKSSGGPVIEGGDARRALERLVRCNLRLIKKITNRYYVPAHGRVERGDLYQTALGALVLAACDYDVSRKEPFLAYAKVCIRRELMKHLIYNCSPAYIPKNAYAGKTALAPELLEAAKQPGVALDASPAAAAGAGAGSGSLTTQVTFDQAPIASLLADEEADTEEEALAGIERDAARRAFGRIPPEARELLSMRYGLADGSPHEEPHEEPHDGPGAAADAHGPQMMQVAEIMARTGLGRDAVDRRLEEAAREFRSVLGASPLTPAPVVSGDFSFRGASGGSEHLVGVNQSARSSDTGVAASRAGEPARPGGELAKTREVEQVPGPEDLQVLQEPQNLRDLQAPQGRVDLVDPVNSVGLTEPTTLAGDGGGVKGSNQAGSGTRRARCCTRCGERRSVYGRKAPLCSRCVNLCNIVYGELGLEWAAVLGKIEHLRDAPGREHLRWLKEESARRLPLYLLTRLSLPRELLEESRLPEALPYLGEHLRDLEAGQHAYVGDRALMANAWPWDKRGLGRTVGILVGRGSVSQLPPPSDAGPGAPTLYVLNEPYVLPGGLGAAAAGGDQASGANEFSGAGGANEAGGDGTVASEVQDLGRVRQTRDPRDSRDPRESRESRDIKGSRETREARERVSSARFG